MAFTANRRGLIHKKALKGGLSHTVEHQATFHKGFGHSLHTSHIAESSFHSGGSYALKSHNIGAGRAGAAVVGGAAIAGGGAYAYKHRKQISAQSSQILKHTPTASLSTAGKAARYHKRANRSGLATLGVVAAGFTPLPHKVSKHPNHVGAAYLGTLAATTTYSSYNRKKAQQFDRQAKAEKRRMR